MKDNEISEEPVAGGSAGSRLLDEQLEKAVFAGDRKAALKLVKAGANPNCESALESRDEISLLAKALNSSDAKAVELLLELGAEPWKIVAGTNALSWAIEFSSDEKSFRSMVKTTKAAGKLDGAVWIDRSLEVSRSYT